MAKTVALIPLRGGSKSIPKKNIKEIAGKPLCFWVINECVISELFDKVYISTEDNDIAALIQSHYYPLTDKVIIINRPKDLATDTATTESVMLHFAELIDFDVVFTIQVTSPLTTTDDFKSALFDFALRGYDSMFTGVLMDKRFVWEYRGMFDVTPLNYTPSKRPMRQEMTEFPKIIENGAFYITKQNALLKSKCRLSGKIGCYMMENQHLFELDEPEDWKLIEQLLELRKQ